LHKQKALLKEMTQDYSFIGAKINVLNSANRILNSNNVIDEDGENSH